MRLSTSTIVMPLLICVPFGLAIRDTLKSRSANGEHDEGNELRARHGDEAEQARAAADQEAAEAKEREDNARLSSSLRDLYGPEPASLGTLFAGVELGMTEVPSELERRLGKFAEAAHIDAAAHLEVTTNFGDRKQLRADHGAASEDEPCVDCRRQLTRITITPRPELDGELACELLSSQLEEAWGTSVKSDVGAHWLSPSTGHRATLVETDRCELTFDRFVPIDKFLNASPTSIVPIWAIGGPRSKLIESLGMNGNAPSDDRSGEPFRWDAPGLGAQLGSTTLTAYVKNGKIVTITASTNPSLTDASEVIDQISRVFHVSPTGTGTLRWKTTPPIEIDRNHGTRLYITVGAPQN